MNPIKKTFLYFNYIFWGFILVFGIIEIMFRIFNTNDPHFLNEINDRTHHPRPYVMAASHPQTFANNPLGYRDFPKVEKATDEWRIAVLGGSTVFQEEVALPEVIQNRLHEHGLKNARVYNIGNISSISKQDVLRIIVDLAGYQPDLILHYGGGNDIILNPDPRINYPHRFLFYEASLYMTTSRSFKDWILGFLMGSKVFRVVGASYLLDHFMSKIPMMVPPKSQYDTLKMKAYYENMILGKMFADTVGAKFVSILQPMLATKKHITPEEKKHIPDSIMAEQNKLKDIFLTYVSSNPEAFHFLDCSDVFQYTKDTAYKDQIHLLPKFQVYPADCIAKFLKVKTELQEFRNTREPTFTPAEYFLTGKENEVTPRKVKDE